MITFEPDSPWEVGDYVIFRNDYGSVLKVVTAVERSEDGSETQYTFRDATLDGPLQWMPYEELS